MSPIPCRWDDVCIEKCIYWVVASATLFRADPALSSCSTRRASVAGAGGPRALGFSAVFDCGLRTAFSFGAGAERGLLVCAVAASVARGVTFAFLVLAFSSLSDSLRAFSSPRSFASSASVGCFGFLFPRSNASSCSCTISSMARPSYVTTSPLLLADHSWASSHSLLFHVGRALFTFALSFSSRSSLPTSRLPFAVSRLGSAASASISSRCARSSARFSMRSKILERHLSLASSRSSSSLTAMSAFSVWTICSSDGGGVSSVLTSGDQAGLKARVSASHMCSCPHRACSLARAWTSIPAKDSALTFSSRSSSALYASSTSLHNPLCGSVVHSCG
mmetsp:Transcript_6622/g.14450  ORF Transcript_6622/g.14450 Transcript_6622/m.14450 type:complete len:335 (+) Transcript_6622:241-1245(+)